MRAAREGSTSKAVARDELLRDLEAISYTARTLALTTPGLEDKFRAPRNLKDQELLALARSFARDALPLKTEFIKLGLTADFMEDLDADMAEFEQAIERRIQGTEMHVAATAAIDDLIERGMKTVRQLDTIMRNVYAGNPSNLSAWLSASHVERAPRASTRLRPPAQQP